MTTEKQHIDETQGGALSSSILIRMTPEMKAKFENKLFWERERIAETMRSWITEYIKVPSIHDPEANQQPGK